jgi:hypothetical protein
LDVVNRLLQDSRVDPSARSNEAIRKACENGQLGMVNRLLDDGRVDPSAMENDAIRGASQNGYLHVVNRLLQDQRVDPSSADNEAIGYASHNGHSDVVERLLEDTRVDPSAGDNEFIGLASRNGFSIVVDRLLQDPRVDPSARDNQAIRWASRNGHLDVVARLIQDDRVFRSITSLSSFPDKTRVVFVDQLARRQCKQSNIDPDCASCAGFIQSIRDNELILKATEADLLPTVKNLIERKWQEVEKGITELQKRFVQYHYRPDGPVSKRLSRKWESNFNRKQG